MAFNPETDTPRTFAQVQEVAAFAASESRYVDGFYLDRRGSKISSRVILSGAADVLDASDRRDFGQAKYERAVTMDWLRLLRDEIASIESRVARMLHSDLTTSDPEEHDRLVARDGVECAECKREREREAADTVGTLYQVRSFAASLDNVADALRSLAGDVDGIAARYRSRPQGFERSAFEPGAAFDAAEEIHRIVTVRLESFGRLDLVRRRAAEADAAILGWKSGAYEVREYGRDGESYLAKKGEE